MTQAGREPRVLLLLSAQGGIAAELHALLRREFPGLAIDLVAPDADAAQEIAAANVLMTFGPMLTDELLRKASRVRWLQVLGAGTDGVLDRPTLRDEVIVTTGHGAQATPVSEAVLALMFALARDIPRLVANQREYKWERWAPTLIDGSTVVIVGIGAIATVLAPKCEALGCRVIGVSSAPRKLDGFERIVPRAALADAASEADYLVVLAPGTPANASLIDADVLGRMRPTSRLVNVSRGGVVCEDALRAALGQGRLAGAALDVFRQEPLPPEDPLWSTPGVLVSPHVAGLNERYARDILPLLVANLRAFMAGDPDGMRNLARRPARSS